MMGPNPEYKSVYMIAMFDYSEDSSLIYYQTAYSTLELAEKKLDEIISKFESKVYIRSFDESIDMMNRGYPEYHIRYIPYESIALNLQIDSYRSYTITKIYVDKNPNEEKVA